MIRSALASIINQPLTHAGFERKRDWFRRSDDVVEVINLQTSQYGAQHYLNYGLLLRSLDATAYPREQRCHVRLRGDEIGSSSHDLAALLDLENEIDDAERAARLGAYLRDQLLPFAATCRTLRDLRAQVSHGAFEHAFIHVAARSLLPEPVE